MSVAVSSDRPRGESRALTAQRVAAKARFNIPAWREDRRAAYVLHALHAPNSLVALHAPNSLVRLSLADSFLVPEVRVPGPEDQ